MIRPRWSNAIKMRCLVRQLFFFNFIHIFMRFILYIAVVVNAFSAELWRVASASVWVRADFHALLIKMKEIIIWLSDNKNIHIWSTRLLFSDIFLFRYLPFDIEITLLKLKPWNLSMLLIGSHIYKDIAGQNKKIFLLWIKNLAKMDLSDFSLKSWKKAINLYKK